MKSNLKTALLLSKQFVEKNNKAWEEKGMSETYHLTIKKASVGTSEHIFILPTFNTCNHFANKLMNIASVAECQSYISVMKNDAEEMTPAVVIFA